MNKFNSYNYKILKPRKNKMFLNMIFDVIREIKNENIILIS